MRKVIIRKEEQCYDTLGFMHSLQFEAWLADQIDELNELGVFVEDIDLFYVNKIDPSKAHSAYNSRLDPVQE